MFEQSHVITDPEARERWAMEGEHFDMCQVCFRPRERSDWRGLTVHHVIRGANGRSDEPCNLFLVCGRCHDMIHDGQYRDEKTGELLPAITLGMVLWAKSQTGEWEPERLTQLYHRRLPDLEELPDCYKNEQNKWMGKWEVGSG